LPWRNTTDSTGNNETDIRDDGSVGFASVQEEWASRSEDDPHWWSKEDEKDRIQQQSFVNGRKTGEQVDTSWTLDEHEAR
jgi:hypothetical protein